MASTALIISSHLVLLLLIILETGQAAEKHTRQPTAEAPGDIMIGILYPLHRRVRKNYNKPCTPWPRKCHWLDLRSLTHVLMLINAIERSNKSPLLRQVNVTLGYRVLDYCGDVSTALRLTADLVQQYDCHAGRRQPIMAIIGPPTSEVSMAIAKQLTFNSIPQISPSSTAERLSDKDQFPAFLRTVPSDKHKTAAMVRFIQKHKWSSVGVVTTVDEYGRAPLDFFVPNNLTKNICVAFQILLPASSDSLDFNNKIMSAAETICNHNNVKVIVSFAGDAIMESLLQEMKNWTLRNLNSSESMRRVWLASDIWYSTVQRSLSLKEIGHIVGFSFQNRMHKSFKRYLDRLEKTKRLDSINNGFLQKFFKQIRSYYRVRTDAKVLSWAVRILKYYMMRDNMLPSLKMAVRAIASAVSSPDWRKDSGKVQPHELLEILKKQKFKHGRKTYSFTKEGDLYRHYVVTLARPHKKGKKKGKITDYWLAKYDIFSKTFTWSRRGIRTQEFMELKNTTSRCFNTCMPGTVKKTTGGQQGCCYKCINCTKNHYSDEKDMDKCKKCGKDEWSPAGSPNCRQKTVDYFSWNDGFAIASVTSTALGIILVLMVSALFFHKADTPVVKAAGGPLCQVILFSLLISYVSAILFVGQPNSIQCKSRQVLFGISFTLCVSCILVKSLKILLAFQFNPGLQDLLRRLYRPYIIIGVVVGMQVIICTCWLLLRGPEKDVDRQDMILLERCNEGSHVAFWVMLGYIAVLAFVCLVCAFKGRSLPREYNDARYITFSMLLNAISWMLFIIIQVTTEGKYLSAVEMIVILISNYSILFCHFFPKCHTILFEKEKNTKSIFRKNLYAYSNQTTDPFSVSGSLGSESQSKCQHINSSAPPLSVPSPPLKPDAVTEDKETNTPVHLYPSLPRGSITHRHLKRYTSM